MAVMKVALRDKTLKYISGLIKINTTNIPELNPFGILSKYAWRLISQSTAVCVILKDFGI